MVVCLALAVPAVAAPEGEGATPTLPPPKERAKELTAKMKEKLALTGDQEDKVAEINLRAAEAVDSAIALPGASRYDRFQSVKPLQTQRDNELKGVLTQDQWKKYKKYKDEFKDAVSAKAELMKKQPYLGASTSLRKRTRPSKYVFWSSYIARWLPSGQNR